MNILQLLLGVMLVVVAIATDEVVQENFVAAAATTATIEFSMERRSGTIRAVYSAAAANIHSFGRDTVVEAEEEKEREDVTTDVANSASATTTSFSFLEGIQRNLQDFVFPSAASTLRPVIAFPDDEQQQTTSLPPPTINNRPLDSLLDQLNPLPPRDPLNSLYQLNRPPPTPTPIRQQNIDRKGEFCGMATRGTLIMHGGIFDYDDPLSDALGQKLVEIMGTDGNGLLRDPLVFVPGARREVSPTEEIVFEEQWSSIMADGVPFSVLHADGQDPTSTNAADAEEADTDGFVEPLRNAQGVFLPGGRQWRLIDAYKYTQTEEELWKLLDRDGVIAGTSAGAAVMGSNMPRGDPAGSANIISNREWYRHGFGFVSNVAVDNHIDARSRELSLYEVLNDGGQESRNLLGIGLNENTMVVIKGKYFEVLGDNINPQGSVVRVYDCSDIDLYDTCTFQNAPYTSLSPGSWYDLCERTQLSSRPSDAELNDPNSQSLDYDLPYSFKKDYKAGNPRGFLCSGRRCRWKSSQINVNSMGTGSMVQITGKVFMNDRFSYSFRTADTLTIRYSINGEENVWRNVFDTSYTPLIEYALASKFGQDISASIPIDNSTDTINIEIVAQTSAEGDAEFQVSDLKIERMV